MVSGHQDPAGEAPWAMQLVVHIDKTSPPSATAVLEAAAIAAASVLAHPEAQPGGLWYSQVQRWLQGRIRKIVRRANGTAWGRACNLPGVTVARRSAEVRAYVPGPTDQVPRELARLQVQGLNLADPDRSTGPIVPSRDELVIAMNPAVTMSVGKAAAQAAHASNAAYLVMHPGLRDRWVASGFPLRVLHPGPANFGQLSANTPVRIVDAGFTELDGPTLTCVAVWAAV